MQATHPIQALTQEPVGIVISRGSRDEAAPVFRAFEYCQAPDDETPERAPQAA